MTRLSGHLRIQPWHLPLLLFVVLCTFTLLTWQQLKESELTEFNEELNRSTASYTTLINEQLHLHAQFLRSLQAFASTTRHLDETAWYAFAQEVQVFDHLQGMFAFAYAPVVQRSALPTFTVDMKKRLKNDHFMVYPASEQGFHLPVQFISPEAGKLKGAIGFDLRTETQRRRAIDIAIQTRDIALSGKMVLVVDGESRASFTLYKALYKNGMPLHTVDQRRAAFSGIVLAAYRAQDFFEPLSRNIQNRFILQVFDDGGSARSLDEHPQLLYTTDPNWAPPTGATPLHHELHFGERNWIIHFYPRKSINASSLSLANLFFISGLLFSLLLALLIFHQTTHRSRAEDYAHRLNADLHKSEERFRLAARGTNDGLWDQNLVTGEEYLSPRLGEIFGFSADAMPVFMSEYIARVLPDDNIARRACLRAHMTSGTPYDIQVRIKKLNGEQAWIRIRGEAVRSEDGKISRVAGSVSDVTKLHKAEAELRAHRDELQGLVEERTVRLQRALHEANLANQAKSEFLANMSHELRTPMHAIISFARLGEGRSSTLQDNKIKQYFERISLSAARLMALINDLLDLSKLESATQPLDLSTVDLLQTLKTMVAQLDSVIQAKQLKLHIDTAPQLNTQITADQKRMDQIINNLLSNAIKFSPAGAEIDVLLRPSQLPSGRRASDISNLAAISLQFIDRGPGIPEDELESIFDKFYQSTRTRTGAGGTGLGLAICREAVRQHHGTVQAGNNKDGGATLTVNLPYNLKSASQPG